MGAIDADLSRRQGTSNDVIVTYICHHVHHACRLSLITGLDCGLDSEDVRLACKTACVVDASALQGHTDIAEPWK